ncbi:hypothetical protein H9L10_12715 [Phycicoccus endophyticus]|uniref:Uncharacterized protein n=1 Tax=Phycicoccus endophyticus TaxID=1690220 RepID=A0A7G9R0G2_9MICO|nr:hypothetical protein [Phycicoccus endophyticus]QNN49087.1 hypothetical protein H9L10_12715 [Phycicoccus endophyticus]
MAALRDRPRGTSIHLTYGVHVWTRRTLAEDLLNAVSRRLDTDPALREALPLGVDPLDAATTATARAALHESILAALDDVEDDELAAVLARRARSAARAEPLDVLAQHAAAAAPAELPWRVRAGLSARWVGATLVTRLGRLELAEDEAALVADVLGGERPPGSLPEDLRRRLVLGGVLVPAAPAP